MGFYFAYGSNMWNAQMKKRCPQSIKIGIAHLPGYRWIISARGYANVIKSKRDNVEGVLFEISHSDEESLDSYEGVALGLYLKSKLCVLYGEEEIVTLVYTDPITEEDTPKNGYIRRINKGLEDAGLSEAYVETHIRRFIPA